MIIIEKEKEEIYPAFGLCFQDTQTIWIRKDLPYSVKKFVLKHEKYHMTDSSIPWFIREVKANLYALFFHPIGAIKCLYLTLLDKGRREFYNKLFRNNL